MKNCKGCKHADWHKTKSGGNHPSGGGWCKKVVNVLIPLPQSQYYVTNPCVAGGYINRKEELKDHCVYYEHKEKA
jgi:hypothetical protein